MTYQMYQVYQVSAVTIGVNAFNLAAGILVPLGLYYYFKKKFGTGRKPFFTGCAVMLLFAFVLEQIVHRVVLSLAAGDVIAENLWLYGLYGGLMAGLFEETGRYAAFRTVLKGSRENDGVALMYGAGHGGFEMFMILALTAVSNLALAYMMNSGDMEGLMALVGLDGAAATMDGSVAGAAGMTDAAALAGAAGISEGEAAQAMETLNTLMAQLAEASPVMFLVSLMERLAALVLQISLSVMVWFSAKGGGHHSFGGRNLFWLYPLAILLHAMVDAAAVILMGLGFSVWLIEGLVWILALGCAAAVRILWTRQASLSWQ